MLNQVITGNILNFRIGDATEVLEERRQPSASDVAVLVDRGRQYRSPVLPRPNGVIRTASEKRNAKWRACDYHSFKPSSRSESEYPRICGAHRCLESALDAPTQS